MPQAMHGTDIEQRLATLERRFEQLVGPLRAEVASKDRIATGAPTYGSTQRPHGGRPHFGPHTKPGTDGPAETVVRPAGGPPATLAQKLPRSSQAARGEPISDLIGGRLLAWVGGAATLVGVVLFLALAVSRGWLGEDARILSAAVACSALMAAGAWLHSRRGRTEAAKAMVGAATAGLYCTLIVASASYHLISAIDAVALSLLVGGAATTLAIRWAGRVVAALGLLGALISPVLVGAAASAATTSVLALACACAIAVVTRQRWTWLGFASVLVCAPQWAAWLSKGQGAALDVVVLTVFATLGLTGAIGAQTQTDARRLPRGSAALAALSACLVAVIGRLVLDSDAGEAAAQLWLAALAGSHAVLGICRFRRVPIAAPLRQVLIAIAVVLADVSFGFGTGGVTLALGWAAAAVGFAWLVRRAASRADGEALAGLGLGAHIALTLIRALVDAPVGALGSADAALIPLLSVSALAAASLGSAQIVGAERPAWRTALNALGLAAVAYLTACTLSGPALVLAWCGEGLALSRFASTLHAADGPTARRGAAGFLALAVLHVLVAEAPPWALVTGTQDASGAALALGAIALAMFGAARSHGVGSKLGAGLLGGSAAAVIYLASVAIVSVFQPGAEAETETVLDLTVRQEGQVVLSTLWGTVGLAALIVGLRRKNSTVRTAALAWLMITVGKVFLYDLSTLTSIFRVVSFVALGLLLLAGAYAYQRLRPLPQPDLRSVHASQR